MNFLNTLNPEQLAAATADGAASTLVLAGAGSGKTRVLTSRIAWLIESGQAHSNQILAVTFTNKAAKEMLHRVQSLLPHLSTHGQGLWIGTFHGLCNRFLRLHAQEAGLPSSFQVLDSQDQLSAVKRQYKLLNLDDKLYPPKQAAYFINNAKENGLRPYALVPKDPVSIQYAKVYEAYQSQCEREGVVDFSELLLRTYEVLSKNARLRGHYQQRFRHILIDEFQDTNTLQYEWLKLLAGIQPWHGDAMPPASVLAVGDDDQSIYGFRGAKVGNMQAFERDFSVSQRVKLEQNYRSVSPILNCANALIAHNTQRLGKALWTAQEIGDKPRVFEASTDVAEAYFITDTLKDLFRQGVAPKDIAILYRSNAQSRVLEQALFSVQIPYRVYGGLRFFERAEVKAALAYLRLLANPDDDNAFLRVVNFPTRGIGMRSIEALQHVAHSQAQSLFASVPFLEGRAGVGLQQFIGLIQQLQTHTQTLCLPELITFVVQHTGLIAHYQLEKEGEARLENLHELTNAAAAFISQEGYSPNATSLIANATAEMPSPLVGFLTHASLEAGDNQALAGQDAVQMMTVHASKGLEFEAVFICGLEEGLFPHDSATKEPKGLEEERRLMYVAITRARRYLWLTFAEQRMMHGQSMYARKSSFLNELPEIGVHWLSPKNQGYRSAYGTSNQSKWAASNSSSSSSSSNNNYRKYNINNNKYNNKDNNKYNNNDKDNDNDNDNNSDGNHTSKTRGDDADTGRGSHAIAAKIMAKKAPDANNPWRVGQAVRHAKFGDGVIQALEGQGSDAKARIHFDKTGTKILILNVVRLEFI